MTKVDPKISDYMRELNKKRKHRTGGFNNPEVLKRAIETRKANALKKKHTAEGQARAENEHS